MAGSFQGNLWRGRFFRYAPLLLWIVVIFLLSSDIGTKSNTSRFVRPLLIWLFPDITEPSIQTVHYWVRKAAHFTEYGVLALLGARALANSSRPLLKNWRYQLSFVLVVLVSLADEAFQSFINDRTATVYDSLLDCAGGLTMLLALYMFRKRIFRQLEV